MKQIFSCFSVLLLAMVFITSSCKKEGPVGPTGATGSAGPSGPAGPKGEAGTANVIYSDWLDLPFSFDNEGKSYFSEIDVPKLTPEILSQGEIKMYVNLSTPDDPTVAPLPYVGLDTVKIQYVAFNGGLQLSSNYNVGTYENKDKKKVLQYRYVIIPGGIAARQSINWDDYDEVKEILQIKD
ncbi:collagen-like triple helix repeat-containing protein [Sporocytophaga myxococcoides]|uniref:collagen-like triple helix repeat-containing protein n=1 Tax=Sporocytophaga myxococcoides TaxID=153721 RepID=UPI00041DD6A3|nr:collagen-like protein [Sporocytophaga myxococcoides]